MLVHISLHNCLFTVVSKFVFCVLTNTMTEKKFQIGGNLM